MSTCRTIESLLLSEPDGGLTVNELAELEAHCAACASCGRQRRLLSAASAAMRKASLEAAVPSASAEWTTLQDRIHARRPANSPRISSPWFRWGVPALSLGAAAALALVLHFRTPASSMNSRGPLAHADFVQADGATSTLVYVDPESGWLIVWADSPAAQLKG